MLPWHQYLLGIIFILAGMNHFRKPKLYEKVLPPYIPAHSTVVLLSGIAEMALGFLLMNKNSQENGAWGIIILMILFLPVHIFMLQNKKAGMNLPKWILILRIPLQFGIMLWAYLYV